MVCFHSAVGLASDRQQVVEVGLINYLWVSFTLLLSIPILKKKARWSLGLGIIVACAGIVIAKSPPGSLGWNGLIENGRGGAVPYALAFVAAVAWALFNNFSRRWGDETDGGAVPVFLLVSGLVLLGLRSWTVETPHWTPRVILELAYMIVFPTLLAYAFWDAGMRKGKIVLLASLSYLIPLLSTIISCAYLRIMPGPGLWLACAMVIGGAAICKRSVAD
jgi:drug/metabolite transporter (DMT)-like permease